MPGRYDQAVDVSRILGTQGIGKIHGTYNDRKRNFLRTFHIMVDN